MNKPQYQSNRSGCKDVFHAFLVKEAQYDGELNIPIINPINEVPHKIISFIDALKTNNCDQWVHFYIDDFHFERIWNNPKKYVKILGRFQGVILPDFSVYRDMPLVMQYWNIYRSRAFGNYLQKIGIKVIVNVRFGDERTYEIATLGITQGQTISIGTHGNVKNKIDRNYLEEGFDYIIKVIKPKTVIIYGSITKHISQVCMQHEIHIINFRSEQYKRYGGK